MPSEISTVSGDKSVEELKRELAEAREQQAATAEILRVISTSSTDLEDIFAAMVSSAARLCDAYDAGIGRVEGNMLRLVAHNGPITPAGPTVPIGRRTVMGRAILDRQAIQVANAQAEGDEYPEASDFARRLGHRTILAVPLLRAGEAIGVVVLRRTEVRPFTDRQIELLKTFADQAVIAIENTRLFEAEQTRTRELTERTQELTETLEFQTALSNVLTAISRSPNDIQPVLDTIVETATRLCQADRAAIWRLLNGRFQFAAASGNSPESIDYMRQNPPPVGRESMSGRSFIEKRTLHVEDRQKDFDYPANELARKLGSRTTLTVPLMREGDPIGVIVLLRNQVWPFSVSQIGLVEAFAAQAVIAIENTRLFEAEQASKRELRESLEYQTATSEVLSVISRSPDQLQPVLDVITAFTGGNHFDQWIIILETLKALQGYDTIIIGHDTPVDRSAIDSIMTYVKRAKAIHSVSADAKTYSESLKAAFPDLQLAGFVDLSASYLYPAPH
jgi:two-component system, NtrC family, sensor kinase